MAEERSARRALALALDVSSGAEALRLAVDAMMTGMGRKLDKPDDTAKRKWSRRKYRAAATEPSKDGRKKRKRELESIVDKPYIRVCMPSPEGVERLKHQLEST